MTLPATPAASKAAAGRGLAAAALLGLALLALGVPRLMAGLAEARGDPRILAAPAPPAELHRLAESRRASLAWMRSGEALKTLGAAEAEFAGSGEEAKRADAMSDLEKGLALAPADPAGWLRLAELRGTSDPGMIKALRLSIYTGAREPGLLLRRLDLGLAAWPSLDEELRTLMRDQIRHAASLDRGAVESIARRRGAEQAVLAILGG